MTDRDDYMRRQEANEDLLRAREPNAMDRMLRQQRLEAPKALHSSDIALAVASIDKALAEFDAAGKPPGYVCRTYLQVARAAVVGKIVI